MAEHLPALPSNHKINAPSKERNQEKSLFGVQQKFCTHIFKHRTIVDCCINSDGAAAPLTVVQTLVGNIGSGQIAEETRSGIGLEEGLQGGEQHQRAIAKHIGFGAQHIHHTRQFTVEVVAKWRTGQTSLHLGTGKNGLAVGTARHLP